MYTNYNIPQNSTFNPQSYTTNQYRTDNVSDYHPVNNNYPVGYQDGDRFFPFLAPFLLGGIAGAAIARPNYFPPMAYPAPFPPPYPVPTPYPAPYPLPTPYPISTNYSEPSTFASVSNTNVFYE